MKIETWPQAREYLRRGKVDPGLKEWFWENRYNGLDFEEEEMNFGRWYFEYLHPEEAAYPDGRVWKAETEMKEGSPAEVMRFIEQTYLEVLGRHADTKGKTDFAELIVSGKLNRAQLAEVLKASPEYKERFPEKEAEDIMLEVPMDLKVHLTWPLFVKALTRSKLLKEKVRPRLDLGRFIEEGLADPEAFYKWFYENRATLTPRDLLGQLKVHKEQKEESP